MDGLSAQSTITLLYSSHGATDTTNDIHTVIEYLIYLFGVADDVDEATIFEDIDEEFKHFGLTAADWFDVICEEDDADESLW